MFEKKNLKYHNAYPVMSLSHYNGFNLFHLLAKENSQTKCTMSSHHANQLRRNHQFLNTNKRRLWNWTLKIHFWKLKIEASSKGCNICLKSCSNGTNQFGANSRIAFSSTKFCFYFQHTFYLSKEVLQWFYTRSSRFFFSIWLVTTI